MDIERRKTIISSFFITVLTGIAFDQSTEPLWEIFKEKGLFLGMDWIMPYIFVTITIRFFIGNQLHLLSIEKEPELFEWIWLFDFVFILSEAFILIFAGKACSLNASLSAKTGFFFFIGALLIVDILWVSLQITLGEISVKWKRKKAPLGWLILNTFGVLSLITLTHFDVLYNKIGLILSGTIFTVAAVVDVLMIDYYGLLKKEK